MAFSAPLSSHGGSCALNAISGIPSARRAAACPTPHHAPRLSRCVSPSSAATSEANRDEVVRVGRVAGAEERDAERDGQRRAVEQARDEVVELLERGEQEFEAHRESSNRLHDIRDRPCGEGESTPTTTTADSAGSSAAVRLAATRGGTKRRA